MNTIVWSDLAYHSFNSMAYVFHSQTGFDHREYNSVKIFSLFLRIIANLISLHKI